MPADNWLSIIIPVYNSAKYLREALDSVVEQLESRVEIVIVDDGSTDESPKIIDEYEGAPRVTVVRQENQGLGAARNSGLQVAGGTYVYFLDSDDRLAPNVLAEMKRLLLPASSSPDVVVFDGASFLDSQNGGAKAYWPNYRRGIEVRNVHGSFLLTELIWRGTNFASALGYVSRRSLWGKNNIRFPRIIHEDENVFLDLMLAARDVSCVKLIIFERRVRADSIMTQRVTEKHLYGRLNCLLYVVDLLTNRHKFDRRLITALERQALNLLISYLNSSYEVGKGPNLSALAFFLRFVKSAEVRTRGAIRIIEFYRRMGLRMIRLTRPGPGYSSFRR